jgi:hypothetical protein
VVLPGAELGLTYSAWAIPKVLGAHVSIVILTPVGFLSAKHLQVYYVIRSSQQLSH